MSAVTIHSLVYRVTADAVQFKSGITATRTELSAAKKLMLETRSPAERLGHSIEALNKLHAKGAIDASTHARALNKLQAEFKETERAAKGVGAGIGSGLGRTALGVAGGLGIATSLDAGISSLINFTKLSIEAGDESVKNERRLAAVISATGGAAGFTAEQLTDYASTLQFLTGVEDDVIMKGQAILSTFQNVQGPVFTEATKLALDMSEVFETDLSNSAKTLGKALNDPAQGISALTRIGVQFTDQQKDQIAALQESGDILAAQGIILDQVAGKVKGAAEAMKTPLDDLKTSWSDLHEEVGKFFSKGEAAGGVLEKMALGIRGVGGALADMRKDGMPELHGGGLAALAGIFAGKAVGKGMENAQNDALAKLGIGPQGNAAGPNAAPQAPQGIGDLAGFNGLFKGQRPADIGDLPEFDGMFKGQKEALAEQKRLQDALIRDAARFAELGMSPAEKLGREMFEIQKHLDAGRLTDDQAMGAGGKLIEDFKGQFKGQRGRSSNTAGGALERNSSEAYSAIMRGMDQKGSKMEKLPDIAEKHLQVAQQTFEALRARADGAVELVMVE